VLTVTCSLAGVEARTLTSATEALRQGTLL